MMNPQEFPLQGGLDHSSTPSMIAPGKCVVAVNYEPSSRGYKRRLGYEAFDGRPSPTEATWYYIDFTDADLKPETGDTLTGATSGATGTVIADAELTSGAFDGSGNGHVAIRDISGTFTSDEILEISSSTAVHMIGLPVLNSGPTLDVEDAWARIMREERRVLIEAVPGSGPVIGVFTLLEMTYAVRNNTGGTASDMYMASSSGWTLVDLGIRVDFENGSGPSAPTGTITKGGTTADVSRITTTSGTWGGGDAAGYFVTDAVTSGPFTAGAATFSGGTMDVVSQEDITLSDEAPAHNGRIIINDFGPGLKAYGVIEKGKAFEFDGTTFFPIDLPNSCHQIAAYQNHLFFGMNGNTLIYSEVGNPIGLLNAGGAGEINLGSFVRVLQPAGSTLLISTITQSFYLTGTSDADFVLQEGATGGARANSNQSIDGVPVYLDIYGLQSFGETQTVTQIQKNALSYQIDWLFENLNENQFTQPGCYYKPEQKKYVAYYVSDVAGETIGISVYFGRGPTEITLSSFPLVPTCVWGGQPDSLSINSLATNIYVGADDGFVYEFERGHSDNGEPIKAMVQLPYNDTRQPSMKKRYHFAEVDVDTNRATQLRLGVDFSDGDGSQRSLDEISTAISEDDRTSTQSNRFGNVSVARPATGRISRRIDGVGRNISLLVYSESDVDLGHTLTSAMVHSTYRGYRRVGN